MGWRKRVDILACEREKVNLVSDAVAFCSLHPTQPPTQSFLVQPLGLLLSIGIPSADGAATEPDRPSICWPDGDARREKGAY